jgi:ssDNA-binding Zn-finger/Zn-ribbon topoisomerase 1
MVQSLPTSVDIACPLCKGKLVYLDFGLEIGNCIGCERCYIYASCDSLPDDHQSHENALASLTQKIQEYLTDGVCAQCGKSDAAIGTPIMIIGHDLCPECRKQWMRERSRWGGQIIYGERPVKQEV